MSKDGTLLLVQIGGVTLTGLIDNSLDYDPGLAEITTKDSSGHKNYSVFEDDWSVSFTSLYDPTGTYNGKHILAAAKAGTEVTVIFGEVTASADYWTGPAKFGPVTLSGPKGAPSEVSGTLQGTGELSPSTTAAS